ncbi:MAG: radical SAM protein [Archaeoglobales archaeon]|nr:MAG: radical SAM protein [Archaeoglobales archaeon]
MLREFEDGRDKVFLIRNVVEVRIPKRVYERLCRRYPRDYIISFAREKVVLHHVTRRPLYYITKESGIPLLGYNAFGLIDRGTNLIQVRPITGCNLNCIFCSVDEGRFSRTRVVDYIVDVDYIVESFGEVAKFKGAGVEAHIDGQGEPTLYPYLDYLVEGLKGIREVKIVSMQTNGILLSEGLIDRLEGYMDRINLSINSLTREIADRMYGVKYPLERVLNIAEYIANSKIDLHVAPVWLPGYNDDEIPKIIEFALEIGAGKRFPPLGIQKYIPHRYGRKPKVRVMSFREFYEKLEKLEEEYGVKLILKPEDFGIERRKRIPNPIRKGEVHRAKIVLPGRMRGEKLCLVKGRIVSVKTDKNVGDFIRIKIVRDRDGVFMGVEV